jgi:hypothetical protein
MFAELVETLQTVGGWGVAAVALVALVAKDRQVTALQEARTGDQREIRAFVAGIVEKQSTLLTQVGDVMRELPRAR